ncbi:MAG TPA: restriction endonuclease subunit S [Haloferula sp.]
MKSDYKQTEVGTIPKEWECAKISSVAKLESGHTPSKRRPAYWGGRIPWVSLHDTEGLNGREIFRTEQTITEEGLNNSSARLLPKGTVVFSRTATIGKTTVLGCEMATSQDFANYVCGPRLDNYFLMYLFRGMGRTWKGLMAGSIHNTIYMPAFKALQIAIPPLSEQNAIAAALSDVDALLASLDRLIAKKRNLKQAAMQQLLTGQARLPGFEGKWVEQCLGECATLKARIGWQGLTSAEYLDTGDYYLVTGTEFRNGAIDWHSCHFVEESRYRQDSYIQIRRRDVLVTKDGTIGKVALVRQLDKPATLNSGVFVIRPKAEAFEPEFFYYLLCSEVFMAFLAQLSAGSTISHLYQKDFVDFRYSVPPSQAEQTAIAAVLSDMDVELAALEQRREKTRALKQGMMQELLTGRTRLVAVTDDA